MVRPTDRPSVLWPRGLARADRPPGAAGVGARTCGGHARDGRPFETSSPQGVRAPYRAAGAGASRSRGPRRRSAHRRASRRNDVASSATHAWFVARGRGVALGSVRSGGPEQLCRGTSLRRSIRAPFRRGISGRRPARRISHASSRPGARSRATHGGLRRLHGGHDEGKRAIGLFVPRRSGARTPSRRRWRTRGCGQARSLPPKSAARRRLHGPQGDPFGASWDRLARSRRGWRTTAPSKSLTSTELMEDASRCSAASAGRAACESRACRSPAANARCSRSRRAGRDSLAPREE